MKSLRQISNQEPVRLGLLLNPNARFNRRRDVRTGATRLLGAGRVWETTGIDALPGAIAHLVNEQKVNVLGICGGDGTMHHTINALLRLSGLTQDHPLASDAHQAMLPILALRGGTLNMLTRTLRSAHDPLTAIQSFCKHYESAPVGALYLRQHRILQLDAEDTIRRFGFIFGSEMTARCLALYDHQLGGGYRALATFLGTVGHAFLTQNALWERHRYLFDGPAPTATITATAQTLQAMPYRALVAATIDIELLGGWICGLRAAHGQPGTMHVRLLKEQPAKQIMGNLHKLMFGQKAEGILDLESASQVLLGCREYSLDGEVFALPESCHQLAISVPRWHLSFVIPPL